MSTCKRGFAARSVRQVTRRTKFEGFSASKNVRSNQRLTPHLHTFRHCPYDLVPCLAKVPPSPCGDDQTLSGDAAEFWKLLAGKVQLTPEEMGVVRSRLEERAAKKEEEEEAARGRRGTRWEGGDTNVSFNPATLAHVLRLDYHPSHSNSQGACL